MLKINNIQMPKIQGDPEKTVRQSNAEWLSLNNDLNVQKMSPVKFDWTLSWEKLTREEAALITQFLYAGTEFKVEYMVNNIMVIDGYYYIESTGSTLSNYQLDNISIQLKAL